MRFRVEELADRCGVSVDTIRYYQRMEVLPRPQREGRVAWYGDEHAARLEQIGRLQEQGFSLAMIGRILQPTADPSEQALAAALAGPLPGEAEERLTLEQLAERTGVSTTLLEVVEREGLLVPRGDDYDAPYTAADVEAVKAGFALLEAGVPLSELLALAREHDEAMRALADRAVDLFARYVVDPIRGTTESDAEAAQRMVDALQSMLPAASAVVSHHIGRRLLAAARDRMDADDLRQEP
ncbi:MAG: MerR family transcriptional regulator [Nitriliruptorales bacterium]|nr:MerR family transcriptional regulator [Nitriliruptorales bacterium]